jgi:hypothetical protein
MEESRTLDISSLRLPPFVSNLCPDFLLLQAHSRQVVSFEKKDIILPSLGFALHLSQKVWRR